MPSFDLSEQQALQLAAYLLLSKKPEFQRQPLGGDAGIGKQRVENSGCVACHQLADATNRLAAPAMSALDPQRGCLADKPSEPAPIFTLKPSEREALRVFVAFYRANPDRSRAPIHDFRARLEQLRCNACHAEQAPSLVGVGEKLQTSWLRLVLSQPADTHDELDLRMPQYHPQHVGVLADGFAKAAGLEPGAGPPPRSLTSFQYVEGRKMLGTLTDQGGLGCIACHSWGDRESLGEQRPNLANAADRLRYDWFMRWMRGPTRIRPGTSMPSYFSGETLEAAPKLETLWAGLAAPASAGLPPGFEQRAAKPDSATPPQPVDEAVVIRTDMPEAAPGALAVGLPGGVSYCFDTGESRLLYAWRGGFVDLGEGQPRLVGDIFYRQTDFPIRVDDVERLPQSRFHGYQVVDGAPELHYEADGVDVFERTILRNGELVRQFRLPRIDRDMWLIVAANEDAHVTTSLGSGLERLQLPRGENIHFEVRIAVR